MIYNERMLGMTSHECEHTITAHTFTRMYDFHYTCTLISLLARMRNIVGFHAACMYEQCVSVFLNLGLAFMPDMYSLIEKPRKTH